MPRPILWPHRGAEFPAERRVPQALHHVRRAADAAEGQIGQEHFIVRRVRYGTGREGFPEAQEPGRFVGAPQEEPALPVFIALADGRVIFAAGERAVRGRGLLGARRLEMNVQPARIGPLPAHGLSQTGRL